MNIFPEADLHVLPLLLDLPSPADEDLSLGASPNVFDVGTGLSAALLNPCAEAIVVPGVPPPVELKSLLLSDTPLPTPSDEFQPDAGCTTSNDLIPFAPVALPTPPLSEAVDKQNLRLPSFDLLGIAVPHPDRKLPEAEAIFAATIGAGPLSKPEDPLHVLSPDLARARKLDDWRDVSPGPDKDGRKGCDTIHPLVHTVTPPYESTAPFNWPTFPPNSTMAPMDTPARSESDNPLSTDGALSRASNTQPSLQLSTTMEPAVSMSWIAPAIESIVSNLPPAKEDSYDSIKVLSHALPCPCTPPVVGGHIFHNVIKAIHENLSPKSTQWINVFHAVPGRFKLDDIPRSPPSTPGPAIGGDDYFTTKIFDSAVQISDYQGEAKLIPSPHPIVVPSTVNVSIVERYIPPTNANEFAEIFSPDAKRSIVLDRLVELSPENGMLLLVYPTKTGGRTFTKDYLGPILDPLLRTMTVTHDLPSELGAAVGPMPAVDRLPEYEDALSQLQKLCKVLTEKSGSLQQFQKRKMKLQIVHASREEVVLDRKIWTEHWWVKQEKPRIRDAVTKVFRRARNLRADSTAIPTDLIQEILTGVQSKRAYPDNQDPQRGVELGVFVILKSR